MRLCLNILLILISILSCYAEDLYLYFSPPAADKAVALTLRCRHAFDFNQQKALDEKRRLALRQYEPLYLYLTENVENAKTKMVRLIMKVYGLQSAGKTNAGELADYLSEEFGIKLDRSLAARMLHYEDLVKLLSGILTIEETILQRNILNDAGSLAGKSNIEVLHPHLAGTTTVPTAELLSLEEARLQLQEKATNLFWQVDRRLLDAVLQLALSTLMPTLKYDDQENHRRIESIANQYPSQIVHYAPGDVLVAFGKAPGDEGVILLKSYQEIWAPSLYNSFIWTLTAIVFTVILFNLFFSKLRQSRGQADSQRLFMLNLLILMIVFLKGFLLVFPFPVYVLPFCLIPLLLILLNHKQKETMWVTLVGAILVGQFTTGTFEIFLYFAFGGLSAVLLFTHIENRWQVLLPSLFVGLINALLVLAFFLEPGLLSEIFARAKQMQVSDLTAIARRLPLYAMGWAFGGGLLAGPLALIFLPLLEIGSRSASTFKLNRFADLQHPLMKELLAKSPGTYQHTMTVAYLAQAVGQAIGANVLLLRIGAYYHDLGKILKPKYFTENQFSGVNAHDELAPEESSEIIVSHVTEGRHLAERTGLPDRVIDIILQHHGDQLVEYFYTKAQKDHPDMPPNEDAFRYPGPKPQSIEAAVLMITDAVEAASRSIDNPTRDKIEALVDRILAKRIADGQFDECDLSTRDLAAIRHTLIESLEASFHSRVKYPWQDEEEKK
jgi:putative nucleotidyltransferase with HDIG domain